MNIKLKFIKSAVALTVFLLILFFIANYFIGQRENTLLKNTYIAASNNIENKVNVLIEEKTNSTSALALALSKNYELINSLNSNEPLQKISEDLRENSNFKNVWIELYDKNGKNRFNSWTEKLRSDTLKPKKSLEKGIKADNFGLVFFSYAPIFENDNFLGFIKVSTKFNSIAKTLKEYDFDVAVLVNKEQSKNIKEGFTNNFLQGYYIANTNVDERFLKLIEKAGVENLIGIRSYKVLEPFFIKPIDVSNGLATILISKPIDTINLKEVNLFKFSSLNLLLAFLTVLLLLFLLYFYRNNFKHLNKLNEKLEEKIKDLDFQNNKNRAIMDAQANIIIISSGKKMIEGNKEFFNFFADCKDIEEFKKKYSCICNALVEYDDENYIVNKDYDGRIWVEHILLNADKIFKVAMYDNFDNLRHFTIRVVKNSANDFYVITLSDITFTIEYQKELKLFNSKLEKLVEKKTLELQEVNSKLEDKVKKEQILGKQKDKIIFEQNKMNSMSNLLYKIAHQWRHHLSVIAGASSGMKLQKELDVLDDKTFFITCNLIFEKTNDLANIIEDFTSFFVKDEKLELRSLSKILNQCKEHLVTFLRENAINLVVDIKEDKEIEVYENDFKQALLLILIREIKALKSNSSNEERNILVKYENDILTVQDTSNCERKEELEKIFNTNSDNSDLVDSQEKEFYVAKEILQKEMNFDIKIEKEALTYNKISQEGLKISIYLDPKNDETK